MVCDGSTITVASQEATMVTIQIITEGQGEIKSSGGTNQLAVRNSITVPAGYDVYFQAVPAAGQTFNGWKSADGATSTQNPITLKAAKDGSITGMFSGQGSGSGSSTGLILAVAAAAAIGYLILRKPGKR